MRSSKGAGMNDVVSDEEKPRRRRGTREETRRRLIDSAIHIVRTEGVGGLTTVNITRLAGIVQSGFYMHFKNVDECLQVAAEEIVIMQRLEDINDPGVLYALFDAVLETLLEERQFTELWLRYLRDKSPLGDAMRRVSQGFGTELAEDLLEIGRRFQMPDRLRRRVELHAEFIIWQIVGAFEAVLNGRVEKDVIVRKITRCTIAATHGEFGVPNTLQKPET
jgi:AcrR family transcriptional regulator